METARRRYSDGMEPLVVHTERLRSHAVSGWWPSSTNGILSPAGEAVAAATCSTFFYPAIPNGIITSRIAHEPN